MVAVFLGTQCTMISKINLLINFGLTRTYCFRVRGRHLSDRQTEEVQCTVIIEGPHKSDASLTLCVGAHVFSCVFCSRVTYTQASAAAEALLTPSGQILR